MARTHHRAALLVMAIILLSDTTPAGPEEHGWAVASARGTLASAALPARVSSLGIPTVFVFGGTPGQGPLYAASLFGFYRTAAPPFTTWTKQNDRGDISAIVPDPRQPDRLLYSAGSTLYRSRDGGRTATAVFTGATLGSLVRAPDNPATLYAVTRDATYTSRITRSSDEGRTWTTLYALGQTGTEPPLITSLTINPRAPAQILATVADYHNGYILASRDRGRTWHALSGATALTDPTISAFTAPTLLAINPARADDLWAAWTGPVTVLSHSSDGGRHWTVIAGLPQSLSITAIQIDPTRGHIYLVMAGYRAVPRLYLSTDTTHFRRIDDPSLAIGAHLLLSTQGEYLITGDSSTPMTVLRLDAAGRPRRLAGGGGLLGATSALTTTVLVAGTDNNLYALDPRDGQIAWSAHPGGALSRPLVVAGVAYLGSSDAHVDALSARTGQLLWRTQVPGAVGQILVRAGRVYVTMSGGAVSALVAQTGRRLWTVTVPPSPPLPAAPLIADIVGGIVYVQSADSMMIAAFAASTGRPLWHARIGTVSEERALPAGMIIVGPYTTPTFMEPAPAPFWPPMLITAGVLAVASEDGRTLVGRDAATGRRLWTLAALVAAPLAAAGGVIYVGTDDHTVAALAARSGQTLWRHVLPPAPPGPARRIVATRDAGLLALGTTDGVIAALDARSGRLVWTADRPGDYQPLHVGNVLYAGGWAQRLMALDSRTGRPVRPAPYPLRIDHIAAAADDILYGVHQVSLNGDAPQMFLSAIDRRTGAVIWGFRQTIYGAPTVATPVEWAPRLCCGAHVFAQTGHALSGAVLAFYQAQGGLTALGYPRTEPFVEAGHLRQYTDRALLDQVGGTVTPAPLGRLLTTGRTFPRPASFASTPTRRYFRSTGHSLTGRFLAYWRTHQGALLLGAPLAEVTYETNDDGSQRTYAVQWFENGRLEYHPALAGTGEHVLLGLVGKQDLQRRGWVP